MNPESNKLEPLTMTMGRLLRANGKPWPPYWSDFRVGELVVIKNYTYQVAYMNESSISFEPVGPVIIEGDKEGR